MLPRRLPNTVLLAFISYSESNFFDISNKEYLLPNFFSISGKMKGFSCDCYFIYSSILFFYTDLSEEQKIPLL